MALNIFAPIVTALTGAAKAYTTLNEAKNKTKTKSSTPSTPTYNEHQSYINTTHPGGYDAYTQLQNDRYNTALQNNDVDLLRRLQEDSQRVGYSLTPKQQAPVMPDYSQQMNDILSAYETYQSKIPNIPYPDMGDYKFNDIQKQLGDLTGQLQNYKGADYMNMDEAIARANSQLGGMYNQSLEQALEQYNKNAIQRGMFGQLPVEALKQNAIAENELNKSNAVNALGANLYSQDFDIAQKENQNYYQQMNKLADLLGQQYNTELGQYQGDLNRYNSMYNQARQADQDYFNNLDRQLSLLGTKYDMQQSEINKYVNNIGQFSNDYMAEINRVTNDNDPSNDWQIAYLQNARNQKIGGMNEAEAKSQSETYKQAMDMFGKLGYATGWIAQALGIPEGTTTATYARLNSGGGSGGSSGGDNKTPSINLQDLTQEARLIASSMYRDGYTQEQFDEIYNYIRSLWTGEKVQISPQKKTVIDELFDRGMLEVNDKKTTRDDIDLFNFLNE